MNKVLIIDDEECIHLLIDEALKSEGYCTDKVLHAYNGMEGFEKFKLLNPSFVILDMRMPGLDGLETYKLIKSHDADANVYLLTGYNRDDITHDVIKLGVKGYISKNNVEYVKMVTSLIIPMLKS